MKRFARKLLFRIRAKKKIVNNVQVVNNAFIDESLLEAIEEYEINVKRILLDTKYYLCGRKELEDILSSGLIETIKYKSNIFDCDNFALLFSALVNLEIGINSVGIVIDYTGGHAYNLVILSDGKVVFIEPQNNQIVELKEEGLYQLKHGVIII